MSVETKTTLKTYFNTNDKPSEAQFASLIDTLVEIVSASTGAAQMPSGTTAQRPSAVLGMVRFNSTTAKLETYEAGAWANLISSSGLPVADSTSIVTFGTDKTMRIDVGAVANSTTRVLTMPDQDIDLTPGTGSFATEAEGTLAASAMQDLVDDTTPQLGEDLDCQGFDLLMTTGNGIHDDSDNEYLVFNKTASAVNHIEITNTATGNGAIIAAAGETNVDLLLRGKATGNVYVADGTDPTKDLNFELGGATTGKTMTITSSQSDDRTLTLPNATDTLVGKATTDIFTNKDIDSDNNTITNIVNADVKAAAAIALNKLAAVTASRMVISDGSGFIIQATDATYPILTELAYVKGVTSAIQTQMNTKASLTGSETLTNKTITTPRIDSFTMDGSSSGTLTLDVPATITDFNLTLPAADGTTGQFLKTDGSGNLSFATAAGSGDVTADGTLTNNRIIRGGGTTVVQDTGITIDDSDNITAVNSIALDDAGSFVSFIDSGKVKFGTSDDATMQFRTIASKGVLQIAVTCGGAIAQTGYVNIIEQSDVSISQRTPTTFSVDPVLRVYSSDGTQADDYIEFNHNQSNANITWGNGALVLSSDGDACLVLLKTASAVNYITITNNSTGNGSIVGATGDGTDTDVDLVLTPQADGRVQIDNDKWPITSGSNTNMLSTDGAGNLSWTAAGSGDVTLTGVQTLTNKTMTAMKVATDGFLADANGNEMLEWVSVVASATNHIQITNAINGSAPQLESVGSSDPNIDLLLVAKGSGVVKADGVEVATLSNAVTLTNKTLTTPTIASFANAAHDHSDAAGGAQITLTTGVTGTLPVANGGTNRTAVPTRPLILMASGAMGTATSGGGTTADQLPEQRELATNDINIHYIAMATGETVFWNVVMPESWDGGTMTAIMTWTSGDANGNDVKFEVSGRSFANDDALDQAQGTAVGVEDTVIAQDDVHESAATAAITFGGTPPGGEYCVIEVKRVAPAGTDKTGDVQLLGVKLQYTASGYSES